MSRMLSFPQAIERLQMTMIGCTVAVCMLMFTLWVLSLALRK